tara:strand:+ start:229 stop:450 length:222 start_codon:yes stop_codon:yes gene_type:complete
MQVSNNFYYNENTIRQMNLLCKNNKNIILEKEQDNDLYHLYITNNVLSEKILIAIPIDKNINDTYIKKKYKLI